MNDTLNEQSIMSNLETHWLGQQTLYYPVVGSTNELLKTFAARDMQTGTLLICDYQIEGKGRLGRSWEAPAGSSLLMSLLFRQNWPAAKASTLTMALGLAAVKSIEICFGVSIGLKWPNDLVIPNGENWLKLGGILSECELVDGQLTSCIVGVGINVNIEPHQFPQEFRTATSIAIEVGHPVGRLKLLLSFLSHLEKLYEAAEQGRSLHQLWIKHLVNVGRKVKVTNFDQGATICGIVEGTSETGQLLVRDESGILHMISAGDATLHS